MDISTEKFVLPNWVNQTYKPLVEILQYEVVWGWLGSLVYTMLFIQDNIGEAGSTQQTQALATADWGTAVGLLCPTALPHQLTLYSAHMVETSVSSTSMCLTVLLSATGETCAHPLLRERGYERSSWERVASPPLSSSHNCYLLLWCMINIHEILGLVLILGDVWERYHVSSSPDMVSEDLIQLLLIIKFCAVNINI